MKKINKITAAILATITTLTMIVVSVASAAAAQPGKFEYEITDTNEIKIVSYYDYTDTLVISKSLQGKPITTIGERAFADCEYIVNITLPETMTSVESFAFQGCSALQNIYVDENNPVYTSVDGVLYSKDLSVLVCCPGGRGGHFNVEKNVDTIGNGAFVECTDITSVEIANSVVAINDSAFLSCTGLDDITIPDSVQTIGDYPFGDCDNLTEIHVSEKSKSFASVGGVLFSKDSSQLVCCPAGKVKDNKNYTIPEGVTQISAYAFYKCTELTSVELPESVKLIGEYAFTGCTGITEIKLPESVVGIGYYAFGECTSLEKLTLDANIERIDGYAFADCTSLTHVTVPDTIVSIGEKAFGYYYYAKTDAYKRSTDFTVICGANTVAQKYAIKNALSFSETGAEPQLENTFTGDADGDGAVLVRDATAVQKNVASIAAIGTDLRERADVDGDGQLSIKDATMIQKYVASIITSFPKDTTQVNIIFI